MGVQVGRLGVGEISSEGNRYEFEELGGCGG